MNTKIISALSIASVILAVFALAIAFTFRYGTSFSLDPNNQSPSAQTPTPSVYLHSQPNPQFVVTFQRVQSQDTSFSIYVAHVSLILKMDLENVTVYQQHGKSIENGVSYWTEQLIEKDKWDGSEFTVEIRIPQSERLVAPIIINWLGINRTFDFPKDEYPPSATFPKFNVTFELIPKRENESRDYEVYFVHISARHTIQDVYVSQWYDEGYDRYGNKARAVQPLIPDYVVKFPNNEEIYTSCFGVWDGSEFVVKIDVGKRSVFSGNSTGLASIRIMWAEGGSVTFSADD
jgi:hypothetical protein